MFCVTGIFVALCLSFTSAESGCGGPRVLTNSTGTFTSLNYPEPYESNLQCKWTIEAPAGSRIYLTFGSPFELEESSSRCFDQLKITEGSSSQTLCGHVVPEYYVSQGNVVEVTFTSDETVQLRGFSITYYFHGEGATLPPGLTPSPPAQSGCGGPRDRFDSGSITSHADYDGTTEYPPNADCIFVLQVDAGKRVELYFEAMDLEGADPCNYDHVTVYDGPSTQSRVLGRFCGRDVPGVIQATSNSMTVTFITDGSVERSGFKANFRAFIPVTYPPGVSPTLPPIASGCGGPRDLTAEYGVIVSHPGFGTVPYPEDSNCEWRIHGRPDKIIRLTFDSFSTEESGSCSYDYLDVHDGPDLSSTLIRTLCGSSKPSDILSTGQSLALKFITDGSVNEAGFRIVYEVIEPPKTCAPNEFTCRNGNCTDIANRCNEVEECEDGSDEVGCLNGECGAPTIPHYVGNGKIVGGRDARAGSWPWMVQLLIYGRSHYCGGSLITDRWVVTAAHCIDGKLDPSTWKIAIGSHNSGEVDDGEVRADVDLLIEHEDYNSNTIDNDIALIRLAQPVVLNDRVKTVCLPKQDVAAETMCYVTGWGETQNTGHPDILKQAHLPVISNEKCNQRAFYDGRITDNMLCAGYDEGGHDTCQGDSGGPLVCKGADDTWEIHGITSWGIGCAGRNKPGVSARVTRFNTWITDKLAENP